MKMTSLFGLAVVCLATSAFAYDWTYILPVKANHRDGMRVELPSGNSSVTARANNDKFISCKVMDAATLLLLTRTMCKSATSMLMVSPFHIRLL